MKIGYPHAAPLQLATMVLSILAFFSPALAQQAPTEGARQYSLSRAQNALMKRTPAFVANAGQWPDRVRFGSRIQGLDMWIADRTITFDLHTTSRGGQSGTTRPGGRDDGSDHTVRRTGHILRMEFAGASPGASATGMHPQPGRYNFFIGNDPARWAAEVPLFSQTRINGIYEGVDALLFYDQGKPRYDLYLAPGADPAQIRIRYEGAQSLRVTGAGELAIGTSIGELTQQKLFAYQERGGRRIPVSCSFALNDDGSVGFTLGAYDRSRPLTIDPVLYSTFLGGSGNDNAIALAVDGAGNAYATGFAGAWSPAADSFPVRSGAYDITHNGVSDVFVTKLDCVTDTLIYSTFIGGGSFEDARSIVLDASNNAYICGYTGSEDFPTTAGSYDRSYNGGSHDAFVLKLNPAGSGLVYSTFAGGSSSDGAYDLAIGAGGGVRVCGYTASSDFPTSSGGYDRSFNGGTDDIVVFSLNPAGSAVNAATFIGGSGTDYAYKIGLDGSNALVYGTSSSSDFPVSGDAYDRSYNGGAHDAVFMVVGAGNGSLPYATYMGGSGDDYGQDFVQDGSGNVVLCGYTASNDYPVVSRSYGPTYNGGAYDIFVSKFNPASNSLAYSTFIGGPSDDYAYGIAMDNEGNAWIAGYTASDHNLPLTPGAIDTTYSGGSYDGYLASLNTAGTALLYSTYIGGGDHDVIQDIAMTSPNIIYLSGTTKSRNFPVSSRAYDDTLGRSIVNGQPVFSYDAFVTKLDVRNLSLTAPVSAVTLCPGSAYTIRWSSVNVSNLRILLSSDGGRSFPTVLAQSIPGNTGAWIWTVPDDLAGNGGYRIKLVDVATGQLADSSDADFRVAPRPAFTQEPSDTTICPGAPFRLTAAGNGLKVIYSWRRNGEIIPNATGGTYSVVSATAADTGRYESVLTDSCGNSVTRAVTVRFQPMPEITQGPQSIAVCAGTAASFSAAAEGTELSYQWRRNGVPIPGATSGSYTIPVTAAADAGEYTVAIATALCPGAPAISAPATLAVNRQDISGHPQSRNATAGQSVTFTVTATGDGLAYQWRKNGSPIPDATATSYTIGSVAASDAGSYDVIVTGLCTATSQPAILTVGSSGVAPGLVHARPEVSMNVVPNPSPGRAVIHLGAGSSLRQTQGLSLGLYNTLGQRVLDLTPAMIAAGYRSAEFDAAALPAGTYYCRLAADGWSGIATTVVIER